MMLALTPKRQKKLSKPNKKSLTLSRLDSTNCRTKFWSLRNRLALVIVTRLLSHTRSQQAAPSEDFIKKSPYYDLMQYHLSKLTFDVERREKRITDLTTELEVLRKERQDLEAIFMVRIERIIVLAFRILMAHADF